MTPTQQFIVAMTKVLAPFLFGGLLGWHIPVPNYAQRFYDWVKAMRERKRDSLAQALTTPKVK